MTTMSPVQEEMEQRTGKKEKIREYPEHMRPVFGHEKKSQDSEKCAENEPSEVIHRNGPRLHRWTGDACTCSYT